jgi:hypothetical protein
MSAYTVRKRRDAAEEVCWALLLMMGLDLLPIPKEERPLLAEPMQKWADLAAATGQMGEKP